MAVLLTFVGVYFPARLEREAITLVSYKMRALLDLTAFTIHPAVYLGDTDAIEEALTGVSSDQDVVYIIVSSRDGIITQKNGHRISAPALARRRAGSSPSMDGSMFEGMTPIIDDGREIARLYIGMSLERIDREMANARIAVAIASAAVLVLGLAGVIVTATYLTRPLRQVASAAETIAAGGARVPVTVEGGAELQRLSSSFNTMIEEVETRASQLQRSHDELAQLSRKLLSVQEEERVAIAREVHDELGHALTILKMDIENIPGAKLDAAAAAHITDSIDSLIAMVRRIATELRPAVLDDLGLRAALEQQIRRLREKTSLSISLSAPHTLPVDRLTASTILGVVQEALSNVIRHADAARVDVRLHAEDETIRVEISDDGRGIDPAVATDPASLGLLGIRERALLLGGHAIIERRPGGGTAVRVLLPAISSASQS